MNNLFGSDKRRQENGEHWLTVSDLMAGLMMVFLFIAIVFMMITQKENAKNQRCCRCLPGKSISHL